MQPEMLAAMSSAYPSIYRLYLAVTHDDASVVGPGCATSWSSSSRLI